MLSAALSTLIPKQTPTQMIGREVFFFNASEDMA
jgi:hypothetical protein